MASTEEKGRAKNIANFKLLHTKLLLFGATYQPSNVALKPANLLIVHNKAKDKLQQFNDAHGAYKHAANERKIAFAPTSTLLARTRSAIKSTGVDAATKRELIDDAASLIRRYRGIRATPLPEASTDPEAPTPDTISVAHTSFVQRAETFNQLISLYSAAGDAYAPSAPDTQLPALTERYALLDGLNTTVGEKISARSYLHSQMFTTLYGTDNGLVDLGYAAKDAVREIFGPNSPEYTQVAGITFRREEE